MNKVFDSMIRRISEGEMENLYARLGYSLDCEELVWDGTGLKNGSVSVYSRNSVAIRGTIVPLHPCIEIAENEFIGNSTISYNLVPSKVPFQEKCQVPGILIVYNGGEQIIPLRCLVADKKEHPVKETSDVGTVRERQTKKGTDSAKAEEKKQLSELAALTCDYFIKESNHKTGSETGAVALCISNLISLRPNRVRYQLYQGVYCVKTGNINGAARIEGKLRNHILSAKKREFTDYCILLYLQYYICLYQKQDREAQVKKRQLLDYINNALLYEAKDPDVVLLLGCDLLDLVETAPEELFNTLQDLWEAGNNSPYLYILGARVLKSAGARHIFDGKESLFGFRCAKEAVDRGLATKDLADALSEISTDYHSVFIYRTLYSIYHQFPDRQLLSNLTLMSIRANLRTKEAFKVYSQALSEKLRIPRLYDYYIYALPADYEAPIPEEVIHYYGRDNLIRPEIQIKLCLNISRFYQGHTYFNERFMPEVGTLLRKQVLKRNWTEDLAMLAGEVLTEDMIDDEFAKALIPMLYLVQVRANVPNGSRLIFESEIFREPETAIFESGKCCISVPGGHGSFYVKDRANRILGGIKLQVMPLMESEELMNICQEKCPEDDQLKVLMTHANLLNKQYDRLVPSVCLSYLSDDSLTEQFQKELLDYSLAYSAFTSVQDILCLYRKAYLMDSMQLPAFIETLIRHGMYAHAITLLPSVSKELLPLSVLYDLARMLPEADRKENRLIYNSLLLYLIKKGEYNEELLSWLKNNMEGLSADLLTVYEICVQQKLNTYPLGENVLWRLLLLEDADISLMTTILAESADHEADGRISKAVMNRICYAYVCGNEDPMEEVVSFIQGSIIHEGSVDGVTTPCRLAMLKYDCRVGFSHDVVKGILQDFLTDIRKKNIMLDFVETEAAKWNCPCMPVLSCDLSANGPFGRNMIPECEEKHLPVYVEYTVNGDNSVYLVEAHQAYATVYSAAIVQFASEKIRYRFRIGQDTTKWINAERFQGLLSGSFENARGLSRKYVKLQQISAAIESGDGVNERIRDFKNTLQMVKRIQNIFKEN